MSHRLDVRGSRGSEMQAFPIRPYFYFRITRRGQTLYTCIDAKELRTHHVQAEAEQTSREDVWDQFILFFSTEQV